MLFLFVILVHIGWYIYNYYATDKYSLANNYTSSAVSQNMIFGLLSVYLIIGSISENKEINIFVKITTLIQFVSLITATIIFKWEKINFNYLAYIVPVLLTLTLFFI